MDEEEENFRNKIKSKVEETGIININVCPPVVASWLIPEPEVDLYILNNNKRKKSGEVVKVSSATRMEFIFTDLYRWIKGSREWESGIWSNHS